MSTVLIYDKKKNEFIQVKKKACKEYNEMHQIKKIAKVVIFMQT